MDPILRKINKEWTLFLDRDGVINRRLPDDYVKEWNDFVFLPGVLHAISIFTQYFGNIFIVTNQQGIGKGLMTESQLADIHREMLAKIEAHGGKISRIYHCPELRDSGSVFRKPEIGMGMQAKKNFPEVDFKRSMMAGDTLSDLQFAHNLKMLGILIGNDSHCLSHRPVLYHLHFECLQSFANKLVQENKYNQ